LEDDHPTMSNHDHQWFFDHVSPFFTSYMTFALKCLPTLEFEDYSPNEAASHHLLLASITKPDPYKPLWLPF